MFLTVDGVQHQENPTFTKTSNQIWKLPIVHTLLKLGELFGEQRQEQSPPASIYRSIVNVRAKLQHGHK